MQQLSRVEIRELTVETMEDGGMGSFTITVPDFPSAGRKFGREVSHIEFLDKDGIPVDVTLNTDKQNRPFEVDIWKIDFSPLIELPTTFE